MNRSRACSQYTASRPSKPPSNAPESGYFAIGAGTSIIWIDNDLDLPHEIDTFDPYEGEVRVWQN